MKLVEHWRLILRQWSLWLGVVGTAVTSALLASPDMALQVWLMMPADLKATIPQQYTPFIGVGIFVLGLVAKFINQAKLEAQRKQ
jgi:predicted membrane chloride channel (bestrophin family)